MTYSTEVFQSTSLKNLNDAINAFFVANPTFVPVSISMSIVGISFYAVLVYGV
jgi:hypothetical protein